LDRILFFCLEKVARKAARRQMAGALARLNDDDKIEASSAVTMPTKEVNRLVAEVMREKGTDLLGNKPKLITNHMVWEADMISALACGAQGFCHTSTAEQSFRLGIEDPKGKPIEKVRKIEGRN
jgi:protein-tyrosine-phosphatase